VLINAKWHSSIKERKKGLVTNKLLRE
jgi:hypothetical protein